MSGNPKAEQRCALSIVTMVYNSRSFLDEFIERAVASANRVARDSYELIFVVDGSHCNFCVPNSGRIRGLSSSICRATSATIKRHGAV
jgi:hypothetical protein